MEHRDSSLLYRPSSVIPGRLFMDITYESVQLIRFLILAASTLFQIFVSFACLYPALGLCLGNACISAVISRKQYMFLAVPCWISLLCCSSLTLPACFIPAGLSSVSLCSSMQGAMARVRGPFTPSQWIELEHQALIYKYLAANSPIPPSLLVPIRRSIASSPYPPSYFGTSTCKPSQEREEQKQSGRVLFWAH